MTNQKSIPKEQIERAKRLREIEQGKEQGAKKSLKEEIDERSRTSRDDEAHSTSPKT